MPLLRLSPFGTNSLVALLSDGNNLVLANSIEYFLSTYSFCVIGLPCDLMLRTNFRYMSIVDPCMFVLYVMIFLGFVLT